MYDRQLTHSHRSPHSFSEGRQARSGGAALRAWLLATVLLLSPLSGVGYGAQSDDPMAPDFDPLGGSSVGDSIGDDSTVGDTENEGGLPGSDGSDQNFDEAELSPGDPGTSEGGGEGAAARPARPRTASSTRRTTPARRTTTTRRTAPSQATAVEDYSVPDASLSPSPSPSPSPSLSPLTTPSPTSSPFFSGALDEGQNTSDEGSSMLPVFVALLLALGLIFMFVSGRRRRRFRPGGGGHSLLRR
jgi:hypothetical protein